VAAVLPALARADEGPVVIANKEQRPTLSLDPIHGALGIGGFYQEQRSRTGASSATATDMLLSQELTLSTGGAIVSRNLATWTGSGTLSLQEEWITDGPRTAAQTGVFDTYDFHLDALGTTAFPFSVYAQRTENYLNRAFAALLRDTTTGYGATFHYNAGPLPSTLSISRTTTQQSSLEGETQFSLDQTEMDYSTSFQPWERHMVSVNLHYAALAQNNPGFVSSNSDLLGASISHNWSIDPEGRNTLTQNFDYSQQSGNFPFTQTRLSEQLRMRHSSQLESSINYTFEQHEYASNATLRHNLTGSITHRLYESLITTLRAGTSLSENSFSGNGQSESARTTNFFTDLGLNYQKKVWLGRFGANLGLGYSQSDNGATGSQQQVIGDVQNYTGAEPIILTRQGVNASSIHVFNAAGNQEFVQDFDYTLRTVGHTVEIDPVVGRGISPGDTVRLNYTIDPLPGYTSRSTSLNAGANYLFEEGPLNGLNLFTHYSQVDQSISPASSGVAPDTVRDTLLGAEYRVWKLTLRAEDENHDSTLSPYDALRFSARYDDRLGDRTVLSINAAQNFIQFPLDHSRVALTTVDGRMQYEIMRGLKATVSARWRHDDDSRTGNQEGFEEQAELRWKIRQTDIFGLIRHTSLSTRDNDGSSFFFQFGLSRSF
jgi:hypothetical protein